MRSRVKWLDTLHSSPKASSSAAPAPSSATQDLTPRTMADSYYEMILPFASSPDMLETYTNTTGGIRTGMLMEHLDSLAGGIAYKHMLGPEVEQQEQSVTQRGFYIVTASVERYV